jgi:hypothetical protein
MTSIWPELVPASKTCAAFPTVASTLTSPASTKRAIQGYETMHMVRKGQIEGIEKGDIQGQNQFIADLFGLAA